MMETLEQQIKALASEPRLRLVNILGEFELSVGEMVQVLKLGQSKISRNLKILLDAGLVACRREGQRAYYRVAADAEAGELLAPIRRRLAVDKAFGRERERAGEARARRDRRTREFFNAIASDWDKLSRDVLGSYDLAADLAERVPENKTAADLGCGTGVLLERLKDRAGRLIGVDNAQAMLDAAASRLGGDASVSLRLGELSHLPLRDREADAVVLSMVLHHLSEPEEALGEAVRALKSGGLLLVADFEPHDNEDMREDYGDLRLGVDPEGLKKTLQSAGLEIKRIHRRNVNKFLAVFVLEANRP
jgi:ArsR family transcriptional regulator